MTRENGLDVICCQGHKGAQLVDCELRVAASTPRATYMALALRADTTTGGTVYEATLSGGAWNETVLHNFQTTGGDGYSPYGVVVLDSAGNLYGTTQFGGAYYYGTVYELSRSQGGWIETILYSFTGRNGEGCFPQGGLVFDEAANLYGVTDSCGVVFELSPQTGGGWNFTVLYNFPGGHGYGPRSALAIDSAGNLYGTVPYGGIYTEGNVFELSPSNGGEWTYTDLYDFTGGNDGAVPAGGVAVTGPGGYLYGTTYYGEQATMTTGWYIRSTLALVAEFAA